MSGKLVSSTPIGTLLPTGTPTILPLWFVPYTQWRMLRARQIPVPPGKFLRPKQPKNITVKDYGWVLDEWDRYLLWEAWIDSGRKGPRPIGLWVNAAGKAISPGWAGDTLKLVHHYRPQNPPPPPPPPLPPPPHYDLSLGRSWIVMAQEWQKIDMYPAYYGAMFTADHAYDRPSRADVTRLRQQGRRVRSWCDCHTTFPDTAKQMAADLGMDGWCGEGESAAAFQVGVDAGAELMIINISALNDDQKQKYLRTRITTAMNELYLNQDESRKDRENWENLPIAGRLDASYDASGEAPTGKRFPFQNYLNLGKFVAHQDSFYDPGATDADRRLVP